MRVQAAPPLHFAWMTSRSGYCPAWDFRAIEAIDEHGRILGMVGFDRWLGNAVEMHVALDSIAAARALRTPAFDYAFRQGGKGIAIGVVPGHNKKALLLAERLGFRETHRIRDGWAEGDDVVLLELRREDCRFLRGDA